MPRNIIPVTLSVIEDTIEAAFAALIRARDNTRQDDGRGNRHARNRMIAWRYYLRRLISEQPHFKKRVVGTITEVNETTKECKAIVEGELGVVEHIKYYPPNTPPKIRDRYLVNFEQKLPTRTLEDTSRLEDGERWIKILQGFELYYAGPRDGFGLCHNVYKIPWPPAKIDETPEEPTLVVNREFIDLIGVDGSGKIHLSAVSNTATAITTGDSFYYETWEEVSEQNPNGLRLSQNLVPTHTSDDDYGVPRLNLIGVPVAIDPSTGTSPDDPPLSTAFVFWNDITAGVGLDQYFTLYSSSDYGATWVELDTIRLFTRQQALFQLFYGGLNNAQQFFRPRQQILRSPTGSVLGGADTPFYTFALRDYGGTSHLQPNEDPEYINPNNPVLINFNGQDFAWTLPEFFNWRTDAYGLTDDGKLRAFNTATNSPNADFPLTRLYKSDNVGTLPFTPITLPNGTQHFVALQVVIPAYDPTVENLVVIEYEYNEAEFTYTPIRYWFSSDAGETWEQMNVSLTGDFLRGIIVKA